MELVRWFVLVVFSLASGLLLVQYFVAHPLQMSRYLLFTLLAAGVVIFTAVAGFSGMALAGAGLVMALFFLAGYAAGAYAFLSRDDPRAVPALTRAPGDPGDGHTAVVYFTHGEPATYDPIGWINQFREFDEQDIAFVPFLIRPYFAYRLRNAYLRVGKSQHRDIHHQMLQSLQDAYRRQGDTTTKFYISFLDDDPRPDAAVIQALNEGASHIVVSEVFLTISNHTAEGEELIEAVDVEKYGATVAFTGPMWDSDKLRQMFVDRANAHLGGIDKRNVGVLLVGHGQPDEWDVEWATETEQEIAFREAVLDLLAVDGFRRENMGLAWMEFKEPKPAAQVEEFYENGVGKVLYYSAAISADSLHSQYDVPELMKEANVPASLSMINLGAWNDDPLVIQAIKEKIDRVMAFAAA